MEKEYQMDFRIGPNVNVMLSSHFSSKINDFHYISLVYMVLQRMICW